MRTEVAELVHPIFCYGLDVREKLGAGEPVDMRETQLDLMRLLGDRRWQGLDVESSGTSLVGASVQGMGRTGARDSTSFLGMRYALVCWLDDLFILHSPWREEWRDHALELAKYNSTVAYNVFWDQAKRAESQPGLDSLEVYYLCVMLGFRGAYGDRLDELTAWVERVRPQIIRSYGDEPAQTDRGEPINDVPLLTGRERFQRMLNWGVGAVYILLFVLMIVLVRGMLR